MADGVTELIALPARSIEASVGTGTARYLGGRSWRQPSVFGTMAATWRANTRRKPQPSVARLARRAVQPMR